MLGRLIGTTAATMLARRVGGIGGPAGTMLAVALPFVMRRMGPAGMVAVAVGSWAVKRAMDDKTKRDAAAGGATIDVKAR